MTRRNATDAVQVFRNAARDYRTTYLPRIQAVQHHHEQQNAGGVLPDEISTALEAHGRNYLIDSLLAALNWNITSASGPYLANLVPEAPVQSTEVNQRRHIDYCGLDRATDKPLMIVEAKRPGSPLPSRVQPKGAGARGKTAKAETIEEIIIARLKDKKLELKYDWSDWIGQTADYVKSVHDHTKVCPKRVVITDGYWCIIFLRPEIQFLDPENALPEHFRIFVADGIDASFHGEIEEKFNELFGLLDYHTLAKDTPPLEPADLLFHFPAAQPLDAIRGMMLKYVEHDGLYATTPRIEVSPVVFLRNPGSRWFRVDSRATEQLPPNEADIPDHLDAVAAKATHLENAILAVRPGAYTWISVEQHYADPDGFALLPGVQRGKANEYQIVTGLGTHYLRPAPSIPNCHFHRWADAQQTGVHFPEGGPVAIQLTSPRVWFPSGCTHHCAHRHIETIKSNQVTSANRAQCGPRSAKEHEAFCEIRGFETHLCCRTCVYEPVCEKAAVFKPPCHRPGHLPA